MWEETYLALETDAAAANKLESAGKNATSVTDDTTPRAPPKAPKDSSHGSSTIAAVAAAHSELRALVNGKIAALLAP